ncbi:MAG: cytochrome c biogenesis protein ResB [Alistipes sp.]
MEHRFRTTGVLAVAMAGATLIEAGMNLQAARGIIYNAWWFDLLLLLLCVNFMLIGRRLNLWSRRRRGALLLHYGFVVILAGAFITHMWGEEGYMHIREGETARRMMTPDRKVQTLPFSVTLNRFTLHRYHGSQSPSSYESDVTIRYRDDVSHRKIYMNNIARVGGYRLYQSSYDPDEQGTILSVNHDPVGTAVSYAGYFLLIAGLIVALCQKGSRFRTLYAKLGKATLVVLFAGSSVVAVAAARPATPGGIAPETAERFGRLLLQSSDGRIEPVDSYASEILRKLYHRDSYGNLNANQVLAGILTDRQTWGREPILYIGQNPLPEEACFPDKYVSFDAMFDDRGDYRLKKQVETIYAKPPAHRTKPEQTLLKLDEKVNILYALLNGQMFPIFPVAGSQRWISPGDDRTKPTRF